MAKNAISEVASYPSLNRAWGFLYRRARPGSRNTRGIDGVSLNDFSLDPKPAIRNLARQVRSGAYAFSPLRPHLIPKTNGKDRLICVPTVRDRIVQRAVLDFVTEKYLDKFANRISYGFVRYRTVQDAADLACQHRNSLPWIFKTDITSFFDQIDRTILIANVRRIIRDRSLHRLFADAADCEIQTPSGSSARRVAKLGIRSGLGVRQGMPLSPFFANVMLSRFDSAIVNAGYTAIRYADDIIFFASQEDECRRIHGFCRGELGRIGLSIPDIGPESKSRIYAPHEPAEFLGLGLTLLQGSYVLRLMPKQVEKIRQELLQLSSIPELLSRKITLANLGASIQNRTAGYLNAYEVCTNILELENLFADLAKSILRDIYVRGLKINVQQLSAEARTFLGLS